MSQAHEMNIMLADADGSDQLSTNGLLLAARNCDLGSDETFVHNTGKRGTRQRYACGSRKVKDVVSGGFDFYPTVTSLDWFFQRLYGDNKAIFPASPADPKETLVGFAAAVDKGYDIFRMTKLYINELTLTMAEGDLLSARVELIGSREYAGEAWPVLGVTPSLDCGDCFPVADVVYNVGGAAYPFKTISLALSNSIPEVTENSLYRQIFEAGPITVSASGTVAYRTDTAALYRRGVAGDAVSVAVTNGASTYTFSLGNVKTPGQKIAVPEDGEITMELAGEAFRTAGAQICRITKT